MCVTVTVKIGYVSGKSGVIAGVDAGGIREQAQVIILCADFVIRTIRVNKQRGISEISNATELTAPALDAAVIDESPTVNLRVFEVIPGVGVSPKSTVGQHRAAVVAVEDTTRVTARSICDERAVGEYRRSLLIVVHCACVLTCTVSDKGAVYKRRAGASADHAATNLGCHVRVERTIYQNWLRKEGSLRVQSTGVRSGIPYESTANEYGSGLPTVVYPSPIPVSLVAGENAFSQYGSVVTATV